MNYSGRRVLQLLPVFLILTACCVRVVVCFQHNPMDYLYSDSLRHWKNGLNFPRGGYLGAADPIVYQAYISLLRRVTHDSRFMIALASALLSLMMPWTYYRAARNFGMAKTPALWAWALIACTPSLITIYHFMMMETLLLFIDGLALWMTARYLRKGGTGPFLDSVVAWTLACLTKPTVIPLAVVCVLWSWWKKKTPVRDIAIAAAVVIVLLVPQSIRSKKELGFIAPFGNPWLTKIQHRSGAKTFRINYHGPHHDDEFYFSSPTCYVRPLEPLNSWAIRRAFGDSVFTMSADYNHGSRDWANAYSHLHVGWDEWLSQWRENILVFLFVPSWPEYTYVQWDSLLEIYSRWIWMPLIVVVIAGNIRTFSRRGFDLLPVATTLLLLFLMFQNVATAEGRYRKPVEPLLLLNLVWLISQKNKATKQLAEAVQ